MIQRRIAGCEPAQNVVRDARHLAQGERRDGMVERTDDRHVEVADIPRDEEGADDPCPVRQKLAAAGQSAANDVKVIRNVALRDDIRSGTDEPAVDVGLLEGVPIRIRKTETWFELAEKRPEHMPL